MDQVFGFGLLLMCIGWLIISCVAHARTDVDNGNENGRSK